MHLTVDEHDRDVLAPLRGQLVVTGDVLLVPSDAERCGDPRDGKAGVRTEMTAGLCQHDDAVGHGHDASRSFPFATLPVTECGSSSTNSTDVGHLNLASRAAAWSMTSRAVSDVPSRATTRALTVSPV